MRIFGCMAYVNVQKDKRRGLQSHTQKCIFIGYPAQYKGWMFLDLETRKELISDTAVFDERVFPGNSKDPVVLLAPEPEPVSFDEPVVVELDESEDQVGVRQPVDAPQPPLLPTNTQMPLTPPPSSRTVPPASPSPAPPSTPAPRHPRLSLSSNLPVYQRRHPLRHTETSPGTYGFQQSTKSASARQKPAATEMPV